jgi:hypothetical protein
MTQSSFSTRHTRCPRVLRAGPRRLFTHFRIEVPLISSFFAGSTIVWPPSAEDRARSAPPSSGTQLELEAASTQGRGLGQSTQWRLNGG